MEQLTFNGPDAVTLALAISQTVEARLHTADGDPKWKPVSNFRARSIASRRPSEVRLRIEPRLAVEKLTGKSITRANRDILIDIADESARVVSEPSLKVALALVIAKLQGHG